MKKIFLLAAGFTLLTVVSCRNEDNVLSAQDSATLKIVQDNNTKPTDIKAEDNKTSSSLLYGDPVKPPKK